MDEEERGEYLDVQLGTVSGAVLSILFIGVLTVTLGLPIVRWYLGDRHYREYQDIVRLNQAPDAPAVTTDPNRTGFMRFWADLVLGQPPVNDVDRLKEHHLTQAVRLDPLRPVYYHHLGHLYVSRASRPGLASAIRDSLLEKALDSYTKAVSRSPLNAAYWFSCAWTLGNLRERDEGMAILRYITTVLAPEREFYKKHAQEFPKLFTQKPKPKYEDIPATPRALRKAAAVPKPAAPAAKSVAQPTTKPRTEPAGPSAGSPAPKTAPAPAAAPRAVPQPTPASPTPAPSTAPHSGAPAGTPVRRSTGTAASAQPATGRPPTTAVRTSTAAARPIQRSTAVPAGATVRSTTATVRPAAAPAAVTPAAAVTPSTAPASSPTTPAPRRRGVTAPVGGW